MKKRMTALLMTALLAIGMCATVYAEQEIFEDSAKNVFISGDLVSFPDSKFFTGFAAGQDLEMTDSSAVGSVLMAGQTITAKDSEIGESLYLAGNQISVDGVMVSGNLFAAGNLIDIVDDCEANAVYAIGSNITFEGETNYLYAAGSSVVIDGTINGDVKIEAETIDIKKGTVITGELIVESATEPEIPDNAEIGKYSFNQVQKESGESKSFGTIIYDKVTDGIYWIIAMGAFSLLLSWLFAQHLERAGRYIKNRTTAVVVSGILGWLFIPVVAFLLAISYIFAPIAAMTGTAYMLLIWAGLAFAGSSIGRIVFPNMNKFLSSFIGVAILEVLRLIPVLGFIIGAVADMYLIGYVIQYIWLHRVHKLDGSEE